MAQPASVLSGLARLEQPHIETRGSMEGLFRLICPRISIIMSELFISTFSVLAGFVVLTLSADRLIACASTLAHRLGVSLMFIGMTVIAFGTSAPELLVSAVAAMNGAEGLSVGNGLGSNIINVGLVMGICAAIAPLLLKKRYIQRDFPILMFSMVLCSAVMWNGRLDTRDGLILFFGLVIYIAYLAISSKSEDSSEEVEMLDISLFRAGVESVLMVVLLLGSSQLMVNGSVGLARYMGASELVIGLTVVAFGTSLPELAAAVAGVRRGLHDIVFATVIGSNIFNLLGVIAFPGVLGNGLQIPAEVMRRDVPAMILLTIVMGLFMFWAVAGKKRSISEGGVGVIQVNRLAGVTLLLFFGYYLHLLSESVVLSM